MHSHDALQSIHLPGIHQASFSLHSPPLPRPGTGVPIARPLCPRPSTGLLWALYPAAAQCRDPFIILYPSHRGGIEGR